MSDRLQGQTQCVLVENTAFKRNCLQETLRGTFKPPSLRPASALLLLLLF